MPEGPFGGPRFFAKSNLEIAFHFGHNHSVTEGDMQIIGNAVEDTLNVPVVDMEVEGDKPQEQSILFVSVDELQGQFKSGIPVVDLSELNKDIREQNGYFSEFGKEITILTVSCG